MTSFILWKLALSFIFVANYSKHNYNLVFVDFSIEGKKMYTRVELVRDWALTQGGIPLFIPFGEG